MTSPEDPALAALAAQVADLRGLVMPMKAKLDHAGMAGGVKLHEQVAQLAQRVDELSAAVTALMGEGPVPRAVAPNWTTLTREDRDLAMAALTAWVDGFLTVDYPHPVARPCWANHPAAVWELSTLYAEWRRIYERQRPELAGALAWHDRWLPGVLARLEKILGDCKGSCTEVRTPPQAHVRRRAG